MGLLDLFRARTPAAPRSAFQSDGPGTLIVSPDQLEQALRYGTVSSSGESVTPHSAMAVPAVFGCVRLYCGATATLPIDIKRRLDDRIRVDASDDPVWALMRRKPNRWQKPHQFKRMMQAHVMLRGNAYALKVPGVRGVQELIPLHPDRVRPRQMDDYSIVYEFTKKDGGKAIFGQADIFHLYGLTIDGFTGVTPLTYARETIGRALSMERYVGSVLGKGARVSATLEKKEGELSEKAFKRLKESVGEFRAGGDKEGDFLILEEGLHWNQIGLSLVDLQWIESQKLTRSDICMFFGVPPSMIGDNSGSDSNWGTGLEQKSNGFVTYGLDDYLVMWEEGITADLLTDPKAYARFNRAGLIKGDLKARTAAYASALQWGHLCPDEVRELEDRNPRPDGKGGEFYPPPNTSGDKQPPEDNPDDPSNPPPGQR